MRENLSTKKSVFSRENADSRVTVRPTFQIIALPIHSNNTSYLEEERKSKRQAVRVAPYGAPSALAGAVSMQPTHRQEPPNHILFVENLPEIANIVMMDKLFSQYVLTALLCEYQHQ